MNRRQKKKAKKNIIKNALWSPQVTVYGTLGRGMAFHGNMIALYKALGLPITDPKGELIQSMEGEIKNEA